MSVLKIVKQFTKALQGFFKTFLDNRNTFVPTKFKNR